MKPVIFYVDDEPHNLTVFEASLPDDWRIFTFDKPMDALASISKEHPAVIVSDQRMPGVTGVDFLELSKKIHPNAIRIIVTGYSDENLVVESVRKAQVFDYIRKPWDATDLEQSLRRAIEYFNVNEEGRILHAALEKREAELQAQTTNLMKMTVELEKANKREQEIRAELECWVPPFILWSIQDPNIRFPLRKNIVGIAFDIVASSEIHDKYIDGKPLRSIVIQIFSEAIIRNGGWRESHSGDSAYGHFGLFDDRTNPCEAALAVAREFRVSLRSLAQINDCSVECGIALHIARDCLVEVHTVKLTTSRGMVTQKSFDSTSSDIDLLHRMEKLVHKMPGSNVVMTQDFVEGLKDRPLQLIDIGNHHFKGQKEATHLFLLPSDRVTAESLDKLKNSA